MELKRKPDPDFGDNHEAEVIRSALLSLHGGGGRAPSASEGEFLREIQADARTGVQEEFGAEGDDNR